MSAAVPHLRRTVNISIPRARSGSLDVLAHVECSSLNMGPTILNTALRDAAWPDLTRSPTSCFLALEQDPKHGADDVKHGPL